MKNLLWTMSTPEELVKELVVLYVEDEESFRQNMVRALKRRVKHVFVATNGKEGIELFLEHKPDVVVSDIKMPLMDGIEMGMHIHAMSPGVPLIYTTAHNEKEFFAKAIEANADVFLTKPIDVNALDNAFLKCAVKVAHEREQKYHEYLIAQEQKHSAIEHLLRNISHYWRNPLTVAVSSFEHLSFLYEEGEMNSTELKRLTDKGIASLVSLSKTIDRFIGLHTQSEYPVWVKIDETILSLIELMAEGFRAKGVHFRTTIVNSEELFIRSSSLSNALVELFVNALEAYEANCSESSHNIIDVNVDVKETICIIRIEDYAGGIAPEIKETIFEPYVTQKRPSLEAGLGLFAVKRAIVEEMGGEITYEDGEKGSRFILTFQGEENKG